MHTTALQAANVAKVCESKNSLSWGHFSARYKDTSEILAEAQSVFKATLCVSDGDEIHLVTNYLSSCKSQPFSRFTRLYSRDGKQKQLHIMLIGLVLMFSGVACTKSKVDTRRFMKTRTLDGH